MINFEGSYGLFEIRFLFFRENFKISLINSQSTDGDCHYSHGIAHSRQTPPFPCYVREKGKKYVVWCPRHYSTHPETMRRRKVLDDEYATGAGKKTMIFNREYDDLFIWLRYQSSATNPNEESENDEDFDGWWETWSGREKEHHPKEH